MNVAGYVYANEVVMIIWHVTYRSLDAISDNWSKLNFKINLVFYLFFRREWILN